jgi:hypothetical protein
LQESASWDEISHLWFETMRLFQIILVNNLIPTWRLISRDSSLSHHNNVALILFIHLISVLTPRVYNMNLHKHKSSFSDVQLVTTRHVSDVIMTYLRQICFYTIVEVDQF